MFSQMEFNLATTTIIVKRRSGTTLELEVKQLYAARLVKNTYQRKYIKQLEDGQYKSCEEIFEEYENEETNGSNSDSGPGGSNSGSAKSKMGGEKRIFKSIYF